VGKGRRNFSRHWTPVYRGHLLAGGYKAAGILFAGVYAGLRRGGGTGQ
jgi:hypothetical protein